MEKMHFQPETWQKLQKDTVRMKKKVGTWQNWEGIGALKRISFKKMVVQRYNEADSSRL
ncbi:hypothetical protein FG379_000989 [Cryptosporidium bovis]|uniref:uncharacterized protein n=1 Tax=Cryptosporidium bovis TaxID=310047 RepID=UPI00351A7F35|nr:hypothetical protein FG379_000989 [Cryptosporidium bovis]